MWIGNPVENSNLVEIINGSSQLCACISMSFREKEIEKMWFNKLEIRMKKEKCKFSGILVFFRFKFKPSGWWFSTEKESTKWSGYKMRISQFIQNLMMKNRIKRTTKIWIVKWAITLNSSLQSLNKLSSS